MDRDIVITIIANLAAVGTFLGALIKVILPKMLEAQEKKLSAEIKGRADEREHKQKKEMADARYSHLQNSWSADKLTDILEQNESFIREQVWIALKAIEQKTAVGAHNIELLRGAVKDLTLEISKLRKDINDRLNTAPHNGD